MSTDLRVGFKERHRKHLHEAIDMVPPPTKKACPEKAREKPGREVNPTSGGASGGTAPVELVLDQIDTLTSAPPPSWDEMMEMLKCVSCFTDVEPPSTKMSDFFPFTKRVSVNLSGDTLVFVLAQLHFRIMHTSLVGSNPVSVVSSSWWLVFTSWSVSAHLLFERLEVAEAMRAFISHRMGGAVAEGTEALKLAEGEREAIHVEAERLKKEDGVVEAKIKWAKQENSQLKKEMEELRAGFTAQKKEMEEL
ncbi:hypothetical protein CK203_048494 [Vitis vinifera]|uniref:Uncharacterized protein n=1 Tax=Vitis vinifera TaxID=29760 RepID=A0A438FXB7_VITVI|nr:hypothetical protein CK203_048494 [Vitis vinifera]